MPHNPGTGDGSEWRDVTPDPEVGMGPIEVWGARSEEVNITPRARCGGRGPSGDVGRMDRSGGLSPHESLVVGQVPPQVSQEPGRGLKGQASRRAMQIMVGREEGG